MKDRDSLFQKAVALVEQGKPGEAVDIFSDLARNTDNLFDKAGILLYLADAYKDIRELQLARDQLDAIRELLRLSPDMKLSSTDDATWRGLLIGMDLEDSRILAREEKEQDALERIDILLTKHRSDLLNPNFRELYFTIRRDRAFLLANLRRFDDALQLLKELYSIDSHDRWILFYLGYCYLCTANYVEARLTPKAIQSGLPPDDEGRSHCWIGAACYELRDFATAKSELEKGVETASPRFIREAKIWGRLRDAAICLGLKAEAEYYATLENGASKPS